MTGIYEDFMQLRPVMVIDDDQDIRECVADALNNEGFGVYCAENGREALDQLKGLREEELPGCIFLDMMMPVMAGPEFLEEIDLESGDVGRIPIVVTSANLEYASFSTKHVFRKIKKPFNLDQIFEEAHRFCDGPVP